MGLLVYLQTSLCHLFLPAQIHLIGHRETQVSSLFLFLFSHYCSATSILDRLLMTLLAAIPKSGKKDVKKRKAKTQETSASRGKSSRA